VPDYKTSEAAPLRDGSGESAAVCSNRPPPQVGLVRQTPATPVPAKRQGVWRDRSATGNEPRHQELTVQRRLFAMIILMALCITTGCSDKASQHRIKMRENNLNDLAGDVKALERHRAQRLNEVAPQMRKWWRQDVELWQERAPTIGDYVW
jgi:hypothetical protein